MDRPLVLAIDFDDTLHDTQNKQKGYKLGIPVKGAVESMKRLKNEGAILIIFSVWADTDQKREAMSKWLRYFEIPYDAITNVKGNADAYIDNKAIRFTDWGRTLEDIARFTGC